MSIERKLLSTLTEPDEIARIYDMGVTDKVFEEPLAGQVYRFVIKYWQDSQMMKAPTAFAMAESNPGFAVEEVEEDAGWLAEVLMRRFATNGVQRMVHDAAVSCHEFPIETLRRLMSEAYDAAEAILPRHSRVDLAENVAERRQQYALREQGIGRGVTLGLPELDEHVGNLLDGELCALGAFSKVGKTMGLCKAAMEARRQGRKPIIFSLEMPVDEIWARMDAMFSGVSYNRLSKRRLDIPEMKRMFDAQDLVASWGPGLRIEAPDEGERTVAHLISRARHTGSDFVLIDQLSFMEETQRYPSEKQRQGSILKQLKNEIGRSSRGKLPCMLAVQLNRESLERADGPLIKDFADAAEVERTCDLLLALSRNKAQRQNRQMLMQILGGRRCEIAAWILRWDLVDSTDIRVLNPVVNGRPEAVPPT